MKEENDGEGELNNFMFPGDKKEESESEESGMKVKIVCHLLSRIPFSELRYMTPGSRKKTVEVALAWAEEILSAAEEKEEKE